MELLVFTWLDIVVIFPDFSFLFFNEFLICGGFLGFEIKGFGNLSGLASIAGLGLPSTSSSLDFDSFIHLMTSEEVAEKIIRHSEALGGISRFSFQLDNAGLSHNQLMDTIGLIGKEVSPLINKGL